MTGQRTVALDRDLPRVREWIDQAVRHAVNEAAQAFNAIRYWCDQAETSAREALAKHPETCDCHKCIANVATAQSAAHVRSLLPAVPERRADSGGEVTGMQGTRVTAFDRELPGGEDTGN